MDRQKYHWRYCCSIDNMSGFAERFGFFDTILKSSSRYFRLISEIIWMVLFIYVNYSLNSLVSIWIYINIG